MIQRNAVGELAFECYARYGNRWSYKGTVMAKDSRKAARHMQYVYGRNVWRVRPEGANVKFLVYRFTTPALITN